jgi:predicted small lipoprotein YifL
MRYLLLFIFSLCFIHCLSGCGQSGKLYLPLPTKPQVILPDTSQDDHTLPE